MKSQFATEWGSSDESESIEDEQDTEIGLYLPNGEDFYCIACEKLFKSDKAFVLIEFIFVKKKKQRHR